MLGLHQVYWRGIKVLEKVPRWLMDKYTSSSILKSIQTIMVIGFKISTKRFMRTYCVSLGTYKKHFQPFFFGEACHWEFSKDRNLERRRDGFLRFIILGTRRHLRHLMRLRATSKHLHLCDSYFEWKKG